MKNHVLSRWFVRRRIEEVASLGFGALAAALYLILFIARAEGQGIWMILYFLGFPISWILNQIVARAVDFLPQSVGTFLYSTQVIFAGMIWVYIVARVLKWVILKLRVKRQRREP